MTADTPLRPPPGVKKAPAASRPASHFQRLYRANPDPWAFNTSPYEQAKYQHTLASLGDNHFESGLEVGCSIGILTSMLAPRCETLLGIDIVEDPLPDARTRCAGQPHVRFERMQVPAQWPSGRFDLIVFSEVLYFLSPEDIDRCAHHVRNSLLPGGTVVLVNWLGRTDDPSAGDAVPDRFIGAPKSTLRITRQERHERYRLDLLTLA
jgi:cyclopropane fatty-acyl-phospholipid synthase-like methyltransferase